MISLYCFMTLLLCVCTGKERGWGEGERAKGSNFATRCRRVAGGGGILLLMNISKPERHAARNFQHTDCQLNSDSNNPPTIIPPPPSFSSLNTLTPTHSFFSTFFLCLRWDKCKTLTGISLAESIAKLLVSFMFLFTDTTNTLHDPPPSFAAPARNNFWWSFAWGACCELSINKQFWRSKNAHEIFLSYPLRAPPFHASAH